MIKIKKEHKVNKLKNFGFTSTEENNGFMYKNEDFNIIVYKGDNKPFEKRVLYIEVLHGTVLEDIDVLFNLYNCGIIEIV